MGRIGTTLRVLVAFVLGLVPGVYGILGLVLLLLAIDPTMHWEHGRLYLVLWLLSLLGPPLIFAVCAYRMRAEPERLTKWLIGMVGVYVLGILSNLITAHHYELNPVSTKEHRDAGWIDHEPGPRVTYSLLSLAEYDPELGTGFDHGVTVPFLLLTSADYDRHGTFTISITFFGARKEVLDIGTWVA